MYDSSKIKRDGTPIGYVKVVREQETFKSGETASNWTKGVVLPGEYVAYKYGKQIVAYLDAEIRETYYVNRVFSATSTDHNVYKPGEKARSEVWYWGDRNYGGSYRPPAMDLADGDVRLVLDDGWVINAEPRGHYTNGKPMIKYTLVERETEL